LIIFCKGGRSGCIFSNAERARFQEGSTAGSDVKKKRMQGALVTKIEKRRGRAVCFARGQPFLGSKRGWSTRNADRNTASGTPVPDTRIRRECGKGKKENQVSGEESRRYPKSRISFAGSIFTGKKGPVLSESCRRV